MERKKRRRRKPNEATELDLFPTLIDRLEQALMALPPDAWHEPAGGGAVASLAERLKAIREEQMREAL